MEGVLRENAAFAADFNFCACAASASVTTLSSSNPSSIDNSANASSPTTAKKNHNPEKDVSEMVSSPTFQTRSLTLHRTHRGGRERRDIVICRCGHTRRR